MPVKFAVANGNWSNTATWNGGTLPQAGDFVFSNSFTVTIDQDINVARISNQTTPLLLANGATAMLTGPNAAAIASGNASGREPWYAFNQDRWNSQINFWQSNVNTASWLGYDFGAGTVIKRYVIWGTNNTSNNPNTWTFQGWDGSSWITLETVTNSTIGLNSFYQSGILANTTAYTRYRVNVTANGSGGSNPTIITQLEMSTSTASGNGNSQGGQFNLSTGGRTLTLNNSTTFLNGIAGVAGGSLGTVVLNCSYSGTCTINGSISGGGGSVVGVNLTTASTLNVTGNVTGGGGGNCNGISVNAVVNLTIVGNVTGGSFTSSLAVGFGGTHTGSVVNITGQVAGGSGINAHGVGGFGNITLNVTGNVQSSSISSGGGISPNGNGSNISIIGNLTAGTGNDCIIIGSNTITLNVTGNVTASSNRNGIASSGAATIIVSGNLINNNGRMAVYSPILFLGNSGPQFWDFTTSNLLVNRRLYTADTLPGVPAVTNVRQGTIYGASNELTGSMIVPTPANVRNGVPTDNTVGTATFSAADIINEIATSSNPVAVRLRNVSTVDSMGNQLAAF